MLNHLSPEKKTWKIKSKRDCLRAFVHFLHSQNLSPFNDNLKLRHTKSSSYSLQMLMYLGLWLLSVTEIVWWIGREGLLFGWREATTEKTVWVSTKYTDHGKLEIHENWSTRKYQREEIIVSQFFRDSIWLHSVKGPIFHDFMALMGEIHLVAR